jgi:hypothetical protein
MIESILLFIFIAGVPAILIVTIGIMLLVDHIRDKRHLKWCNKILKTHPELKVLLSEYHRLWMEHLQTVKDSYQWQKDIDEWTEKNKYLPIERRVDEHIENLKRHYCELLDIQAEQDTLIENAKKDLVLFWETNFPDLPEHKRLMWWE